MGPAFGRRPSQEDVKVDHDEDDGEQVSLQRTLWLLVRKSGPA
jgi:hypothetical protein